LRCGLADGVAEADDFRGDEAAAVVGERGDGCTAAARDGERQRRQKGDADEDIEEDVAALALFHGRIVHAGGGGRSIFYREERRRFLTTDAHR